MFLSELLLFAGLAEAGTVALAPLVVKDGATKTVGAHPETYQEALSEPLATAGIGGADPATADLVLVATVAEVQTRTTKPPRFELSIDWSLDGRAAGTPVYKVTTRALVEASPDDTDAVASAIRTAADRLVARTRFREAVEKGAPNGELMPGNWDAPLRVKQCPRADLTMPKQVGDVTAAVVVVNVGDSVGTGSVVSPDGFVVTAAHVVGASQSPNVRFRSGVELPGEVVRVDESQDVAVLRVPGAGYACIPMEPVTPGLGADLFAVGSPAGLDYSVSRGIVSGVRTLDGWTFLQTDAAINPGNSGGPLLDDRGRMVGVTSWKVAARGFEGLGFGVPIPAVLARLGVTYGDTSDTDLAALRGTIKRGTPSDAKITDTPDPRRIWEIPKAELHRQKMVGRRVGGIVLAGLGVLAVGGTGLYAADAEYASDLGWGAATFTNTLGWLSLLGGGAMIGLSYTPAPTSAEVPGVFAVSGSF